MAESPFQNGSGFNSFIVTWLAVVVSRITVFIHRVMYCRGHLMDKLMKDNNIKTDMILVLLELRYILYV